MFSGLIEEESSIQHKTIWFMKKVCLGIELKFQDGNIKPLKRVVKWVERFWTME